MAKVLVMNLFSKTLPNVITPMSELWFSSTRLPTVAQFLLNLLEAIGGAAK